MYSMKAEESKEYEIKDEHLAKNHKIIQKNYKMKESQQS